MGLRAAKAQVLFYMGRRSEAERCFAEAQAIVKGRQRGQAVLTYIWGFWQCEMWLDIVEDAINESVARSPTTQRRKLALTLDAVRRYVTETLSRWQRHVSAQGIDSVFDRATAHLTLARERFLRARLLGRRVAGDVRQLLEQAVQGLRETGQQHHLVGGLLVKARFRTLQGDFRGADADLKEASDIAERSEMVLHQIDAHLESARKFRAQKRECEAAKCLDMARSLALKTGYHRRDRELGIAS